MAFHRTNPRPADTPTYPSASLVPRISSKPPKRRLGWGIILAATATLSAGLGAIAALVIPFPGVPVERSQSPSWLDSFGYRLSRPVNLLVLGVDRVPDVSPDSPEIFAGRSDTVLIVRFDSTDESLSLLSIPRDTRVEIPGFGTGKINEANRDGGADLAMETASQSLGGLPLDGYIRINTEAFVELVDLVGGVEVFVPYPMSYVDRAQQLEIDLEAGWQTLNGSQAQQFAKYRQGKYGDIGRVQRQQALLKALRDRLKDPAVLPHLPDIVRVMQKYIDTDLRWKEIVALARYGLKLDADAFRMVLLPGRFSTFGEYGSSYWIPDNLQQAQVLHQYFDRPFPDNIRPADANAPATVSVAIQNATDNPDASEKLLDFLLERGIEDVYVAQDWSDSHHRTHIIAQQGNLEAAKQLQSILGVGDVRAMSTGDLDSDVTIRLGRDWLRARE